MTLEREISSELFDLVDASQAEGLTPAQTERLRSLLRSSSKARQYYIRLTGMQVDLYMATPHTSETNDQKSGDSDIASTTDSRDKVLQVLANIADYESRKPIRLKEGSESESAQNGGTGSRRSSMLTPGRLAAAIVLVAGLITLFFAVNRPNPPVLPATVAVLTESVNAQWDDAQGRLIFHKPGKPLPPGTLYLVDGVASLKFENCANIILDARTHPTTFEITSACAGYLHKGKVTTLPSGDAEPKAFELGTPTSEIVQKNAQFGLVVDKNGQSDVHVFEGSLSVRPRLADGKVNAAAAVQYNAGDAVAIVPMIDGESQVTSIITDPGGFLQTQPSESIKTVMQKRETSQDERWAGFVDELKQDNTLVYFLEGRSANVDTSRLVSGRFGTQSAIRFAKPADEIIVPNELRLNLSNELTVALWVKPTATFSDFSLIVGKGDRQPIRNYSIWMAPDLKGAHKFHFSAYGTNRKNYIVERALPAADRWHFVVGVIRNKQVMLFVDGQMVQNPHPAVTIITDASPLRLGRSGEAIHPDIFRGDLEMVAIFNRGLSDEEIQQMYRAGRQ